MLAFVAQVEWQLQEQFQEPLVQTDDGNSTSNLNIFLGLTLMTIYRAIYACISASLIRFAWNRAVALQFKISLDYTLGPSQLILRARSHYVNLDRVMTSRDQSCLGPHKKCVHINPDQCCPKRAQS